MKKLLVFSFGIGLVVLAAIVGTYQISQFLFKETLKNTDYPVRETLVENAVFVFIAPDDVDWPDCWTIKTEVFCRQYRLDFMIAVGPGTRSITWYALNRLGVIKKI